jgi:hypothetical protein
LGWIIESSEKESGGTGEPSRRKGKRKTLLILAVLQNEVFHFKVFQDVVRVFHNQGVLPHVDGQVAVVTVMAGLGE